LRTGRLAHVHPDIALAALRAMQERFGDKIYGRYGFTDALHPTNGWIAPDVLGLDTASLY
jgi:hypothetical protein